MKKVLIVTYYWPPSGGSGVQRWLKFAKYFRDFGIEPVIYTAKTNYSIVDESLSKDIPAGIEVIRTPILEPVNFLNFLGVKKNQNLGFLKPNPSLLGKILRYIRANFFIPDARKFWIQPSVHFLKKYLKDHQIDTIITTGPPQSLHLIGLQLKLQCNCKWIADFRDPWTKIDYFQQLPMSKKTWEKHRELEKKVVQSADAVTVTSSALKNDFLQFNKNTHVITNGFDDESISGPIQKDNFFSVTHIGLMNSSRNPAMLWEVIVNLLNNVEGFAESFKLRLIGKVDETVKQEIARFGIEKNVEIIDYVPHQEVAVYQKKTQVLLLIVNDIEHAEMIVPGKLFEYLHANNPIIAIAPTQGDVAKIIEETHTGKTIEYGDKDMLKQTLVNYYDAYKLGFLSVKDTNTAQFHRKMLTKKMATLVHDLSSTNI
jgi:glycosyltransferase involved in cell wall biosynthesis